ncbi:MULTISPECIES: porin [unclassified Psychrobacter]|uniref:porin n=1 Tax=unclassified Psychrobacter TaxID=196806 RepID=UPI001865D2B9|nr:porin [Psychrobacter sp. FME61]
MKKLLLATAVAALSVSAANAAPTVYGKAFLTLDVIEADTDGIDQDERTKLNSASSRVGFKGSEALTANTDVVYQLEYGVDADADDGDQFYARDTYLGLANDQYGTMLAGRLTAVDDYVNFANVTAGGVIGGDAVLTAADAPRIDNALAYFSPDYNGVQVMAMYGLDEAEDGNEENLAGIAATYGTGPMNVGASYLQSSGSLTAGLTPEEREYEAELNGWVKSALRVSGNYAVSPVLTVGALYQNTDFDTDNNENLFTISGEMATATPWTAYAQGDFVTNDDGQNDDEAFRATVGGKYAFNAATTGHLYGAYLHEEDDSANSEYDGVGIGAGLEYNF